MIEQSSSLSPDSKRNSPAHKIQATLAMQSFSNKDNSAQLEAEIQQFEKRSKLLAGIH